LTPEFQTSEREGKKEPNHTLSYTAIAPHHTKEHTSAHPCANPLTEKKKRGNNQAIQKGDIGERKRFLWRSPHFTATGFIGISNWLPRSEKEEERCYVHEFLPPTSDP
jgi:hypothetical protein